MADLKPANSPQDEPAVVDLRRKWSTIPRATPAFQTISRHVSARGGFLFPGRAPEQQFSRIESLTVEAANPMVDDAHLHSR